jgi:riboflavin biosynthesis pyrimidine reductase
VRSLYPDVREEPPLEQLYAYPRDAWLRVNMVGSVDGAAWLDGLSGGLSGKADRRVFGVLRGLADVIVAGAATVRAEGYRPARRRPGRDVPPPIAVVSARLDLDFGAPLFTEAESRTIVVTCESAPQDRLAQAAGCAEVIVAGGERVVPARALAALRERGLGRVLCEGGPRLNAQLAAAGLIDELCLTVSPMLVGGPAARILHGEGCRVPLTLAHILEDDGTLFHRYVRT